jgi:hypothetical protein
MKVSRIAALAALSACVAFAVAGTATAVPAGKWDAQVLGNVKIDENDPTVGYVTARYVCSGESAALWVSVKQTESRTPDPGLKEEGSSSISAAWSHSHRNPVTCDGKWQTGVFTIDQVEWGFGELQPGQGYVQFCLGDDSGETDAFTSSMRFAAVG